MTARGFVVRGLLTGTLGISLMVGGIVGLVDRLHRQNSATIRRVELAASL